MAREGIQYYMRQGNGRKGKQGEGSKKEERTVGRLLTASNVRETPKWKVVEIFPLT